MKMSDKEWLEKIKKLKEENKRLREALEFYANGNHCMVYYDKIILLDDGEKARQALEGEE